MRDICSTNQLVETAMSEEDPTQATAHSNFPESQFDRRINTAVGRSRSNRAAIAMA